MLAERRPTPCLFLDQVDGGRMANRHHKALQEERPTSDRKGNKGKGAPRQHSAAKGHKGKGAPREHSAAMKASSGFEALGLLKGHEAEFRHFRTFEFQDEWESFSGPVPQDLLREKALQGACEWWEKNTMVCPDWQNDNKSWGRKVRCLSLTGLMVALHETHFLPEVYNFWLSGEVVVNSYMMVQALRATCHTSFG